MADKVQEIDLASHALARDPFPTYARLRAAGPMVQVPRVEAQVGLERLFTRYPRLALAVPDSKLKYSGHMLLRALVALPVRLR